MSLTNVIDRTFAAAAMAEGGSPEAARVLLDQQELPNPHHARNRLLWLGAGSLGVYLLIFMNESLVLDLSSRGKFFFIVPVVIAFLVSFIHGAFTDAFWRFLGITRKTDTNSHPAASSQPSHAA